MSERRGKAEKLSVEHGWFVADDGRELACYEAGDPDGPTLVFCGGLGGSFSIWRPLLERFAPRYRLLGWDYRGLYRSVGSLDGECGVEQHVRDLRALLRHAQAESPVLLGWSMGVQVGLELHRETPEPLRGFVAIHGTAARPVAGAFDSPLSEQLAPPILSALRRVGNGFGGFGPRLARTPGVARGFVRFGRALGVMAPSLDVDRFREIAEDWLRLDFTAYADLFAALDEHDASDLLPRVKTPCLIFAGEEDRFTPAHRAVHMAGSLPDAELEHLPGATHFGLLEFPERIGRRVGRFLHERLGLPAS
jgi:pimeloyl-ACP methyl ester carboxylesterase